MSIEREVNSPRPLNALDKTGLPKRTLLESILSEAGKGLLSFAKFSGLMVTTSIADLEEGLRIGGELNVKRSQSFTEDPVRVPEWHAENKSFNCFYFCFKGDNELKECLHISRPGFSGGAIFRFNDGSLIGSTVNATKRLHLSADEEMIAKRLLQTIKAKVLEEQYEVT